MQANSMNDITYPLCSFGALDKISRTPTVSGSIRVMNKNLTSLDGCPEVIVGDFSIGRNHQLCSLVGGPREVGIFYSAYSCGLTSLEGLPVKIQGTLNLTCNPLTSLQGINQLKEMGGILYVDECPITSHILGVFFIKGCKGISASHDCPLGKAVEILNRHIGKGRAGLLACTNELIGAGLADFAQI
jgi:hypothetical protein